MNSEKIKSVILFILGYALSPLTWWNDIFFNLPIAYAFGYIFGLINRSFFLPATIIAYWLTNLLGFILMQKGFVGLKRKRHSKLPDDKNQLKNIRNYFLLSMIYTLLIYLLLHFKIIDMPSFK